MLSLPVHGERGWELLEYEWSARTGAGHFRYGREPAERMEFEREQRKFWTPPAA